MNRRDFFKFAGIGATSLGLSNASELFAANKNNPDKMDEEVTHFFDSSNSNFNIPLKVEEKELATKSSKMILRSPDRPWAVELTKSAPAVIQKTEFVILQATKENGTVNIIDPYDITPDIDDTDDKPDVALTINMDAFHLPLSEDIDRNTRATMKITTTNATSISSGSDDLYWAVTSAIDLYKQSKLKESQKSRIDLDLKSALSERPIELTDGLGSIQLEIIKHEEPKWWERVFKILQSDEITTLATAIGFPAITKQALGFIDELLNRIKMTNQKVLVSSDLSPYAFSKRGKKKYETGIKVIGGLNAGTWILTKPEHHEELLKKQPYFYGSYGRFIPKGKSPVAFAAEINKEPEKDPFREIFYAVFTASLTPHKFVPDA